MENDNLNIGHLKTDETWRDEPIKKRKKGGWPRGRPRGPRVNYKKNTDPRGVPQKVTPPEVERVARVRVQKPEPESNGIIIDVLGKTLKKMENATIAEFPALMGQMRAILMMAGYRE